MVDIGSLDRRFEIQKPTKTQDAFGAVVIVYSRVARRWGSLRAITGTDRLNANAITSEVTHNVIMRKDTELDIKPDWRLVMGDRTFDIIQVFDPDDRRRQWNIEVSEVVPL